MIEKVYWIDQNLRSPFIDDGEKGEEERRRGGEGRTKAKLRRLLIKEAVPLLFDSINGRFSLQVEERICMYE